jgi:hypothetical protein
MATWNVEWATPRSDRGTRVAAALAEAGADVIVVTEGVRGLLPSDGFVVDAGGDWGYGLKPSRRKVIVWSRFPLIRDFLGEGDATRGRLAVATAATPDGPLRIIGVCIPWQDAHVRSGRCDARPWSEHLDYLDRLETLLAGMNDDLPTVIAGDFNQRLPRGRQPIRVFDRLSDVLSGWTIHTGGVQPNGPHIDHIATNQGLSCESVRDWPASDHLGRLSDHAGLVCRLSAAEAPLGGTPSAGGSVAGQGSQMNGAAAAPGSDRDPASDRTTALAGGSESDGKLTRELRAEIEDILRRSSDGLEHGASFRLRERGLTDAEIAAARGVELGSNRVWLRSLDALLEGYLPTSKTAAEKNSYGYRELLNHQRSDALNRYVMTQLHKLKDLNPAVRLDPLNTRPYQYRKGNRQQERVIRETCSLCGTVHPGEC